MSSGSEDRPLEEGSPGERSPAEGTPAEGLPVEGSPAEGLPVEGPPADAPSGEAAALAFAEDLPASAPTPGDPEETGEAPSDADTAAGSATEAPRRGGVRRRRSTEAPEQPAEPQPVPRRRRRDPSLPAPVVRAQAKYVRTSARKARLVCDHIRGKTVDEARAILAHTPRAVAHDWSKLLESAVANAEHNHELVGEDLYVKAVHADEGPTIKRFRPRAMGRATKIRKRTSHLTILLTPKE
jgi:ribosomal protein L22